MSPNVFFCLGFHPAWTKTIEVLQIAEDSNDLDVLLDNLSFLMIVIILILLNYAKI